MEMNEINRRAETKAMLFSTACALAAYSVLMGKNIYSRQIPEISPRGTFLLHLTAPSVTRHSPEQMLNSTTCAVFVWMKSRMDT